MIVTENIRDFPVSVVQPLGIAVKKVDEFLVDLYTINPSRTRQLVDRQASDQGNPPSTTQELLDRLARAGAVEFVSAIREGLSDD